MKHEPFPQLSSFSQSSTWRVTITLLKHGKGTRSSIHVIVVPDPQRAETCVAFVQAEYQKYSNPSIKRFFVFHYSLILRRSEVARSHCLLRGSERATSYCLRTRLLPFRIELEFENVDIPMKRLTRHNTAL